MIEKNQFYNLNSQQLLSKCQFLLQTANDWEKSILQLNSQQLLSECQFLLQIVNDWKNAFYNFNSQQLLSKGQLQITIVSLDKWNMIPPKPFDRAISNIKYRLGKY